MVELNATTTAMGRSRRLVWNNDGSDMLQAAYAGGKWPVPLKSVDQFIDNLMRFLIGTRVDSIFYCAHVNEPDWEHPSKNIAVLGPNPVQHVVDFAHAQGMEFFYSIRMNDIHAGRYPPKASYWPPFRLKHPELLMGNIAPADWQERYLPWISRYMEIEKEREARRLYDPEREAELRRQAEEDHPLADVIKRQGMASVDLCSWAAYDYAKPAVRARYLEVVEGACERYNLDGIELDWLRHPMFFRLGEERRSIPIMNDFVHQVRQCLDRYGQARGRAIQLAVRTPDTMDLSLSLGLDFETWAHEGWIDLLMAGSGFMPFSVPMREWVRLGHQHGIPVYGCLDRLYPPFRAGRPKFDHRDPAIVRDDPSDYDAVRAAAFRYWDEGVDGIYLYDWHTHHGPTDPSDYGFLPEIENPFTLGRQNKQYRIDIDRKTNGAIADACLPGQLPRAITTQSGPNRVNLSFRIVDNPVLASQVSIQIKGQPESELSRLRLTLNDVPLLDSQRMIGKRYSEQYGQGFVSDEGWFDFKVSPPTLKKGLNDLEVTVDPPTQRSAADPVEVIDVRVTIAYT